MSRIETFGVLFVEKLLGAMWGIIGYRSFQQGDVILIVLTIGVAAAFTHWRAGRISMEWGR